MNQIWVTNAEVMSEYFELVGKFEEKINKVLNRDEREIFFMELMKLKNIKPSGNTELNKDEFINELLSKGNKILNIDENGCKIIKNKRGVK